MSYVRGRKRINIVLAIAVCLIGAISLVGWATGAIVLTATLPGFVTMKSSTALSFILASFIAIIINSDYRKHMFELAAFTYALSLQVVGMVIAQVSGLKLGVNWLPIAEADPSVYTVEPHLPSIGTMLAFGFIVYLGFSYLNKVPSYMASKVIMVISLIALAGYAFNVPALYYYIPSLSTGMAINTAIGFFLLAICFYKPLIPEKIQ